MLIMMYKKYHNEYGSFGGFYQGWRLNLALNSVKREKID